MRKLAAFVMGAALALAPSGCLIVLADHDFDDDVEVVEIDGEYYIKDKSAHRVKKVEVQKSSTTTKETTKEGGGS